MKKVSRVRTKTKPEQIAKFVTILMLSLLTICLTIFFSGRVNADEVLAPSDEPPKPAVMGIVLACVPAGVERDYLCQVRFVQEGLDEEAVPPFPKNPQKNPQSVKPPPSSQKQNF